MQIITVYYCLLTGSEICDHDVDSNFVWRCLSLLCDAICLYAKEFCSLHRLLSSPLLHVSFRRVYVNCLCKAAVGEFTSLVCNLHSRVIYLVVNHWRTFLSCIYCCHILHVFEIHISLFLLFCHSLCQTIPVYFIIIISSSDYYFVLKWCLQYMYNTKRTELWS